MKLLEPTTINCVSGGKISLEVKTIIINDEISEACLEWHLSVPDEKNPYLRGGACSIEERFSFMNSAWVAKVISISEI